MKKKQIRIVKRRRREGKTDYKARLVLLKSNSPRLVVRKSNRYVILQLVESSNAHDKILVGVSTKELLNLGWPADKSGSLKSLGACYLAGLLLGKKISEHGKIKGRVILDSGLIPNTKGSRVYAAAKGVKDSGVDIKISENVFPVEERIKKHKFFEEVEKKIGGMKIE